MEPDDRLQEYIFRSRIADYLFGLRFPVTKEGIIRQARHNNTASQAVEALQELPDRTYAGRPAGARLAHRSGGRRPATHRRRFVERRNR